MTGFLIEKAFFFLVVILDITMFDNFIKVFTLAQTWTAIETGAFGFATSWIFKRSLDLDLQEVLKKQMTLGEAGNRGTLPPSGKVESKIVTKQFVHPLSDGPCIY